jgi:hypothetical protein
MSASITAESLSDVPADVMELEAVCRAVAGGRKVGPELRKRIDERADKVREEIFRQHGVLDIGVPIIRELRDAG